MLVFRPQDVAKNKVNAKALILFLKNLCKCENICILVWVLAKEEEGMRPPGVGFIGDCELLEWVLRTKF